MPKRIDEVLKRKWPGYISDPEKTRRFQDLGNDEIRAGIEKLRGETLVGSTKILDCQTKIVESVVLRIKSREYTVNFRKIVDADKLIRHCLRRSEFPTPDDFERGDESIDVEKITDDGYAPKLAERIRRTQLDIDIAFEAKPGIVEDLVEIRDREIDATTRETLVDARIGQGKFRDQVLERWDNQCAVTGCRTQEAIRASHIKPWRISTNKQRLDPKNGLPLIATLDSLFDAGLISFSDDGAMLVSGVMNTDDVAALRLMGRSLARARSIPRSTKRYLEHHRDQVFRD